MHTSWKMVGGSCVIAVGFSLSILGRSPDVSGDPSPSVAFPPTLPEPTTHPPVMPKPGDEQPPRDPFAPYAHGSPAPWEYDDLTAAEQAIIDRGVDTSSWDPVHAAFNAATIQQAQEVATEAAAIALGVSDLTSIGVVP